MIFFVGVMKRMMILCFQWCKWGNKQRKNINNIDFTILFMLHFTTFEGMLYGGTNLLCVMYTAMPPLSLLYQTH